MVDSFLTIASGSASEIKITKSKFIAHSFPVVSADAAAEFISSIRKKYYDAAHFPFAYRLGTDKNNFKSSDDGEPSGSGGKPILEAIDKLSLTDVVVVVVRYFGGTKLGVGGLRRAFFEAADECLNAATVTEKLIEENVIVKFDYKFMNVVMKLIETEKFRLVKNNSGEMCELELMVRLSKVDAFKKEIIQLTNGSVVIS